MTVTDDAGRLPTKPQSPDDVPHLSNTSAAVLGMVVLGARSGYEIRRAAEKSVRFFWALGPPQIYAELKRLKTIIEAVEAMANHRPPQLQAFFLLDEILKGTNSNDRHTGSKALIRQLIRSQGSGIIATHDLELGQLAVEAGGHIENLCIEVEIQDGQLYFDYKLKKGVSQSFNATLLMKQMGIKIEEEA